MKNENFGSYRVSLASEGIATVELLSEKNFKTVNINFRDAKRLKDWVRIGGGDLGKERSNETFD